MDGVVRYRNMLDYRNRDWLMDDTQGRVADSMWLNYWWNWKMIDESVELAEALGLDPFESLFLGVECGYGRFEGSAMYSSSAYPDIGQCQSEATVKYLDWILDDDGNPQMSLALWGGDFVHEAYGKVDNLRYTDGYQWISEERERMWYTSPKESAVDHSLDNIDRTDVEVGVDREVVWKGLWRSGLQSMAPCSTRTSTTAMACSTS